ncbi:MAG: DUF72 domain-containing protein [Planctomycetes bacterium]|nr:DUF72 domain-containing protein [Planctomycetota bacterium]
MAQWHVGTSGFSYDEWKPAFYPQELKSDAMLAFYSARLPAVELNATFYRMPSVATVANWQAQVPAGFVFAVKATQKITWVQKLRDCGDLLARLFEVLAPLQGSLGCVFYQLPKWVRKDVPLLREFLAAQPPAVRVAFEFAHASWNDEDAVAALRERDAAVVLSDKDGSPTPELIDTGTWGYLRLRRPAYTDDDLRAWRDRIDARGWERCFLFFKHEDSCAGPALARRFLDLPPVSA